MVGWRKWLRICSLKWRKEPHSILQNHSHGILILDSPCILFHLPLEDWSRSSPMPNTTSTFNSEGIYCSSPLWIYQAYIIITHSYLTSCRIIQTSWENSRVGIICEVLTRSLTSKGQSQFSPPLLLCMLAMPWALPLDMSHLTQTTVNCKNPQSTARPCEQSTTERK